MYGQEEQNNLPISSRGLYMGALGMGATIYAGRVFKEHERSINSWVNKQQWSAGYAADGQSLLSKWNKNIKTGRSPNYSGGFRKNFFGHKQSYTRGQNAGPKINNRGIVRSQSSFSTDHNYWKGGVLEDLSYYSPFRFKRLANFNAADKLLFNKSISNGMTKLWKASAATALTIPMVSAGFEETGHFSEGLRSVTREALAVGGSRIGQAVGSTLGHVLASKAPWGGYLGMGVTSIAGAMVGYGALDVLDKARELGRKWSTPETGGKYMDSSAAMSMRQRSMLAIKTSQFNLRSELGNEALHFMGI